jgi:hypothetical protein
MMAGNLSSVSCDRGLKFCNLYLAEETLLGGAEAVVRKKLIANDVRVRADIGGLRLNVDLGCAS